MAYSRHVGSLAAGLVLGLSFPQDADARDYKRVNSFYELSWSGLTVASFEASLEMAEDSYRMDYTARTAGFLEWFVEYVGTGFSHGGLEKGEARPEEFSGQSRFSDRDESWLVRFDDEGKVVELEIPEDELEERDPVPTSLQKGPDPVALLVTAINRAGQGHVLDGQSFDGKRAIRADLNCSDRSGETLSAMADGPDLAAEMLDRFAGHGITICELKGELLAGGMHKYADERENDKDRPPARVWLLDGIAGDGWWPVKLEAETRFGTVTAKMTDLESSIRVAERRN